MGIRFSLNYFALSYAVFVPNLFAFNLRLNNINCITNKSYLNLDMKLFLKLLKLNYVNLLVVVAMTLAVSPIAIAQEESKSPKKTNTPRQNAKKTDSEYVNNVLPEATRIQEKYGIPIDLTIAIARHESGNGKYIIGKGNHFGLRCDSDDCIVLEKNGQMINYETCPDTSECFDIFAESIKALGGKKPFTTQELYRNGYATSPTWVERVDVIRKEVQQTLSEAGIKY